MNKFTKNQNLVGVEGLVLSYSRQKRLARGQARKTQTATGCFRPKGSNLSAYNVKEPTVGRLLHIGGGGRT
jgi:hypothetical protein